MYKVSNGFLWGMFKFRTDSIPYHFNESFRFSIQERPAFLNLLTIV
jgi:hypothetical protein